MYTGGLPMKNPSTKATNINKNIQKSVNIITRSWDFCDFLFFWCFCWVSNSKSASFGARPREILDPLLDLAI